MEWRECEFRGGDGIDAARERLQKVLEQELPIKERASALYLLGEIARAQKDNKLVIQCLTKAIELAPPSKQPPITTSVPRTPSWANGKKPRSI